MPRTFASRRMMLRQRGRSLVVSPPPASAVQFSPSGTPTFFLASTAGATNSPYTVGVAMHKGAVPTGQSIVVEGVTNAQVDVRNRWPDGSVKFCVVSGTATVAAGVKAKATLKAGTPPAAGAALTEADLLASGVEATLQFAGGPVVALRSLIGVAAVASSAGTITGGRVRQVASGPRMSSWLYAAPASATNAHLVAWFEVRFYGGTLVHVLPWIENGWTRVGSCAGQVGALTFSLGGTQRFTASDVHIANHCRVVAQDVSGVGYWAGTAPDLYVAPDPIYLQRTGLVPSYFADSSGATARLNALAQSYSPANYGQLLSSPRNAGGDGLANGDFDAGMSVAGYHGGIGLLPEWDAFFLSSKADQRAWNAVIANAFGYGRYGVHLRDELTLRPINPPDVALKTIGQSSLLLHPAGIGRGRYGIYEPGNNPNPSEVLPQPDGYLMPSGFYLLPELWAQSHHPSGGYLAYLLTGHEWFLEQAQFVSGACFVHGNSSHRQFGKGLELMHLKGHRTSSWGLRSHFQAATISRDGDAMQAGITGIISENIAHYHTNYIATPCGSFGVPRPYSNVQAAATPPRYNISAWEQDFWVATWGWAGKLGLPIAGTDQTKLDQFFQWSAQWIVGRLGPLADATTFGYNIAGRQFSVSCAKTSGDTAWDNNQGPWFAHWGEVFEYTVGESNALNNTPNLGSHPQDDGFFPDPTSYWGNLMPAISYAVELGVPGAAAGYERLTNAPNFQTLLAGFGDAPVWGVRPPSRPSWALSLLPNTWQQLPNTNYQTWATANIPAGAYKGTNPLGAIIEAYCDPAHSAQYGAQYFYGGGHGDGSCNAVIKFDHAALEWSLIGQPTPPAKYPPSFANGGSLQPGPLVYPSGLSGNGFFLPSDLLTDPADAPYATPLARGSSHMYGAAAIRGDTVFYFYNNYAEFNTTTGQWAGRGISVGAQLASVFPNYDSLLLDVGTQAYYDSVTDRFFVTNNPGDTAGAWRSGFIVFNPNTRTIQATVELFDKGLMSSNAAIVAVGRKLYLFLRSSSGFDQPQSMNAGVILDMDLAAAQTGRVATPSTALVSKFITSGDDVGTFSGLSSIQETIPAFYDGKAIRRWNYESRRQNLYSVAVTPASGSGTAASPYVLPQTVTTLTGTPPVTMSRVYKRAVWNQEAGCMMVLPVANSNWFAVKVA